MAKRTCDPTSGSIGRQVYLIGRNGQVVRTRAIPANPKTDAQLAARAHLTDAAKGWDALTDVQRAAWRATAAGMKSKPRLGMSGALTGIQLYVMVNANRAAIGTDTVQNPPSVPEIGAIPVTALTAANASNVITLKLTTTDTPDDGTELWAAAPVKAGVNRCPSLVLLGLVTTPVNNAINITTQYAARFGTPAVGQRVFVQLVNNTDGYKGRPIQLNAVVPTST